MFCRIILGLQPRKVRVSFSSTSQRGGPSTLKSFLVVRSFSFSRYAFRVRLTFFSFSNYSVLVILTVFNVFVYGFLSCSFNNSSCLVIVICLWYVSFNMSPSMCLLISLPFVVL